MTPIAPAAVDGATQRSAPLTGHQNGCISTVSLHVAMSMLSCLATALADLKAHDYAHMRHRGYGHCMPRGARKGGKRIIMLIPAWWRLWCSTS